MSQPRGSAGFTLIEVVVALALASMVLAVILPAVTTAARRQTLVHQRVLAAEQGVQLVDRLSRLAELPSPCAGADAATGMIWSCEVSERQPTYPRNRAPAQVPTLRTVTLAVRAEEGAELTFEKSVLLIMPSQESP